MYIYTFTYTGAGRIDSAPEFLSSHTLLLGSPLYLSFLPSFLPSFILFSILLPSSLLPSGSSSSIDHKGSQSADLATGGVIVDDVHATPALTTPVAHLLPRFTMKRTRAFVAF